MKKQLIVSGIVFIILIVGLSGCSEVSYGIVNIGDISANPDKYYGKEVTIEGTCIGGMIADDKGHAIEYQYSSNLNGMYRLTGIVVNNKGVLFNYYLDVSQVKAL